MQAQGNRAQFAVTFAVAVAGVYDIVNVLGVQRDESEAMGEEFVSEDRGVGFDFDNVNGHDGDFCEHHATERVGKGEVNVG